MGKEVVITPARVLAVATRDGIAVPRVIAEAGDHAIRPAASWPSRAAS